MTKKVVSYQATALALCFQVAPSLNRRRTQAA